MDKGLVYLDYNATTPISGDLRPELDKWLAAWGNPSSIHQFGRGPKQLLREARRSIAQNLGCHPLELIFTSGGSEANNLAIQGFCRALTEQKDPRRRILYSAIEHPSVRKTMEYMASQGFEVLQIPANREGQLDMEFYDQHLNAQTALVSVMLANNEIGVISPIKEMAAKAKAQGAYFHADCVQAIGKLPFDLLDLGVDMASFSSHKIYALRGSGFLYVKKATPLSPMIFGGAQERKRRAGTENLMAIASQAFMIEKLKNESNHQHLAELRDHMETRMNSAIEGLEILAKNSPRLPNTSMVRVDGVDGEVMMMNLDIRGFAVSTGAACSSGNPEPNPVLLAMGLSREEAQSSLRISLGQLTTREQIDSFVDALIEVVDHLRTVQSSQGVVHG